MSPICLYRGPICLWHNVTNNVFYFTIKNRTMLHILSIFSSWYKLPSLCTHDIIFVQLVELRIITQKWVCDLYNMIMMYATYNFVEKYKK